MSTDLLIAIGAAIPPTATVILTWRHLRKRIDGRLDELVELTRMQAEQEGAERGHAEARGDDEH